MREVPGASRNQGMPLDQAKNVNADVSLVQVKVPSADSLQGAQEHVKEGCAVHLNLVDPIAQAVGLNSLLGHIHQPPNDRDIGDPLLISDVGYQMDPSTSVGPSLACTRFGVRWRFMA